MLITLSSTLLYSMLEAPDLETAKHNDRQQGSLVDAAR